MWKYLFVYLFFALFVFWRVKKERAFDKKDYLARMNLFRGIFAIDIIIGHVAGHDMIPLMPFEKFSIVSVAAFFFLSGSGLVNSYYKKENYAKKMPSKIVYLFSVTILLYLIKILIQILTGKNLGYITDNIIGFIPIYFEKTNWYIWELILLYIVFMVVYGKVHKKIYRVSIIFASSLMMGILFAAKGMIVAWYYSIFGFSAGILFGEYFEECMSFIHSFKGKITTILFLLSGLLGYVIFQTNKYGSFITRNMFCIGCIIVIIFIIERYVFDNKMIRCCTKLSLELYLYQSLWLDLSQGIASEYIIRMIIVFGGTFITALLIYPLNQKIREVCSRI